MGTFGAMIGKYEREEITPSVEIANKIAKAIGISLDYLAGNTVLEHNDKLHVGRGLQPGPTIIHFIKFPIQPLYVGGSGKLGQW